MTEKFFTKEHEWIVIDGTSSTIGITQYAQEQLGDVVHVDLPEIGKTVAAGDEIAVVESVKAASELFSPVSGKIGEVNNMVINNPSIINIRFNKFRTFIPTPKPFYIGVYLIKKGIIYNFFSNSTI